MSDKSFEIPAHVPAQLVFDFDVYTAPELKDDPYRSMSDLLRAKMLPVFYTPRNGGHWVITGAVEGFEMLRDVERFSNDPRYNSNARKPWTLPNQSDPPDHTEYRRIINPAFVPRTVAGMETDLRQLTVRLIDDIAPRGGCEFVAEVGKLLPVNVFLKMAGAPASDRSMLVDLTERVVRHPDRATREAAGYELGEYVMKAFAERRANPGDDLLGMVLRGKVNGNPLNEAELLGMGLLLFLGGLDTVSSTLAFVMLFLARNPRHYQQLVDNPGRIAAAVEELIRTHSVAAMQRGVRNDTEIFGIRFLKNDKIFFMAQLFGLDERKVDDPLRVDFDRAISPHLGFGAGPHRCIGSHLARTEIRIFLEEWTQRIPKFCLAVEGDVETCGGNVWSPIALPLKWP